MAKENQEKQTKVGEAKVVEKFAPYQILLNPMATEKCIRSIEFENVLTFSIHSRATKQDVKKAVEAVFNVKVAKVNLHNSFTGKKKAYVRLRSDFLASDVSADLGFI